MSKSIKTNERELASKVSEWLNEIIKRSNFPFSSASNETGIKVDTSTKFGDIIIWKDRASNEPYSYIELKPPFGSSENLETFRLKALEIEVQYALTWDFQNLNAYKIVKNKIQLVDSETEDVLNRIDNWIQGDNQAKIKAYLQRILDELINLNETGKFRKFYPDKVYFVNFIRKAVNDLVPKFENFLKDSARKSSNKHLIAEYVTKQGIAYPSDAEYYKLIARQTVYALVTKIIFYLTVRRYFDDLPDIYKNDEPDINKLLKFSFARAREKDWQAVFVEDPIEVLGLPETIYDDLHVLFSELKVYHFGELSEDVIGELFEEIIDPNSRHLLGQYFTNEDLVDLIIGFAVQDEKGIYGDPTCGSGTFLIRLYDRLRFLSGYKLQHKELLDKIWGIDIGKFPAELSTINLFRQNISNYENFPRVIRTDIFDVTKGAEFDFPPPNAGKHFTKIKKTLPFFNGFVGNFPFIRQELIEKKNKGYKRLLTKVIAKEYFLIYPDLFEVNGLDEKHIDELKKNSKENFEKEIDRYVEKKNIELKLSGQADIYTYIFIHITSLLANNSTISFITSNTWLDTSFGGVLKQFLLDHFNIRAVVASYAEPWFEDVAANTIFIVLDRESNKDKRNNNDTRFIKLKSKLEELIPQRNLKIESANRWKRVDDIIRILETLQYDQRKSKKLDTNIISAEDDNFRIRIIKQQVLFNELLKNEYNSKWGKYLRAPDVYFEILEKCKDKLVPLKSMADVRRGYTTGINDFFYLEEVKDVKQKKKGTVICKNARGWQGEIEKNYLKKVIKDSSKFDKILISMEQVNNYIFVCNHSKERLKKARHINALKYIEWGEKQKNKSGILFPKIKSVIGRKYWYGITSNIDDEILFLAAPRQRFLTFHNKHRFLVDKRMYSIKSQKDALLILLNSFLYILHIEAYGKEINNGNAKEFTVDEVKNMLLPDVDIIFDMNSITKRIIRPIFQEIKQKDRKELDTSVLKALGLDPKEYLPRIYEGITQLVKERLELPKMRKKQKSQSVKVAYDEIKKAVIEEIIPNGMKKFPEAFYSAGDYDSLEFDTYNSNGKQLKADSFFDKFELKDDEGKTILETDSDVKAEFVEMLTKKEIYQIKIPKNEKVLEKIISSYKLYVKNLRQSLETNAHQKLHDWSLAEKMADEILVEWS